jgi:hypothetical protein
MMGVLVIVAVPRVDATPPQSTMIDTADAVPQSTKLASNRINVFFIFFSSPQLFVGLATHYAVGRLGCDILLENPVSAAAKRIHG